MNCIPGLRPKDRRAIQSHAHDWYKATYHTKFHMTKSQYLDCLCDTAIRFLDVKEPDSRFKELMTKAFTSLKALVDNPTTAGLPNPSQTPPLEPIGQKRPATASTTRENPRAAKAKMGTYAEVAIAKSTSVPLPIGAKSAPPKTPAKYASGAIGAPVPPKGKSKAKAKSPGSQAPIGASSTAKQGTAKRSEPPITSDTALEYLQNASPTTSFQDYQTTQVASADPDAPGPQPANGDQTVQDDQTAQHDQTPRSDQATQNDQTEQDEQIARAVQADLDAQAAKDAIAPQSGQDGNLPDLDDDDDAVMQQVLMQSRQTAQPQGSDPQATSSAGTTQSIEQELQRELKLGIGYQTEVQTLQLKMSQEPLTSDEVARYRTVSKLASDNHARVAELCDRQVQESLAQTSRNTRAILGSIQPLNLPKPKGSTVKPPPSSKDTTGACSTSAPGKQGDATGLRKAPPPILGANRPPVVKIPPQGPPKAPPKGQGSGAKSLPIQGGAQAPASPKPTLQSHLIGKNVSPRGHPPPRVLPRSNNPSRQSSVAGGNTPMSARSEATADLEEKLRKKKEAKRARPDEQDSAQHDERDLSRQQESRHHKQGHRSGRDSRRRNRTPSQDSSSSDTSEEDRRSRSSRGSRTRRHRHSRRQRSRSRRGSRSERRRRGSSEEEKRSRSKRREREHRSSKDRKRRDSSSSSEEKKSEDHEEVRNKSSTSQPVQAKAAEPPQRDPPPLPPPATTPTTDSSGSAAVPAVQQTSAQPIQRQVAQAVPAVIQTAPAIGSAAAHLPMARAVPLHQPQGHTQVAAQPDPKAMPARQVQGHVSLAQPLPQPLYPPQHHMLAVQPRPLAQQFAAPPGLGANQQAAQAAHIQQMEQQLAALQAQLQLRNTQPQAQSRSTSQSPDGWGWGSQSQDNQWQDHGWYNWGNGRGYQ